MAKPTINPGNTTRPTTPERPNTGAWRAIAPQHYPAKGGLPMVDPKLPFDRIAEYDEATNRLTARFTVQPDANANNAYVIDTVFAFPKNTPKAAALWAGRALVVDMQSRIRSAMTGKRMDNAEGRARAFTAATWSGPVNVTEPDAVDPAKRLAGDIAAMERSLRVAESAKLPAAVLTGMRDALTALRKQAPTT